MKKKLLSIALTAIMSVGAMSVSAYGDMRYSGFIDSPSMTAGQWWSGYDEDEITEVDAHFLGNVKNSEVGMYFYNPDYGLSNAFYRVKNRVVSIQLKEDDPGDNANETIRTYVGYFDVDEDNKYVPVSFKNTGSTSEVIEDNGRLELYVRVKVNTYYMDYDDSVRSGIMCYRYWVNS